MIDSNALSFVKIMDDIIIEMTSMNAEIIPSDDNFADTISSITKGLSNTGRHIKKAMVELKNLKQYYNALHNDILTVRGEMDAQISERSSMNYPGNMNGTFYSEENTLTDIQVTVENDYNPSISNISIDVLTDPKEYSTLSIMQRYYSDITIVECVHEHTCATIKWCEESLKKLDTIVNAYMKTFTNGASIDKLVQGGSVVSIHSGMSNIISIAKLMKTNITKIFQVYNEIQKNYFVYKKVVDSYCQLALESMFGNAIIEF